jgi:hypothetical protein
LRRAERAMGGTPAASSGGIEANRTRTEQI